MGSLSLSVWRLLCGREIPKIQDIEWLRKLTMHLEIYKKVLVLTFFLCTFEKTLTSSFDVSESSCSVRYIMTWGVFRIFCWIPSTSSPHRSLTRSLVFDCAFFCLGWAVSFFTAYAFSNVSFTFKKIKRYWFFNKGKSAVVFTKKTLYTHIHSSMHKITVEYRLLEGRNCGFYVYLYLQLLGQWLACIITNIYWVRMYKSLYLSSFI